MCGICASIGGGNQVQNVLRGLKDLEYRGYDSSGIAYLDKGEISLCRSVGQICNLEKKIDEKVCAKVLIGHTRWATHGRVCEENSHPHLSFKKTLAMVHNGIIENFETLKSEMKDVEFRSQTDTEVFANLIERQSGKNVEKLISASKIAKGSFAVAVIFKDEEKIYCAKRKSPLYVAYRKGQVMTASDISAFENKFDYFYILEDDEFAVLSEDEALFFDCNGEKIEKEKKNFEKVEFFDVFPDEKCFMRKEIAEEPIVLKRTFFKYFSEKLISEAVFQELRKYKSFHFIACGTAYHSGLLGAEFLQFFAKKSCLASVASEFRYGFQTIKKDCVYVFVSQSGETADTIACADLVKKKGGKVLCVTNVPYSSLNSLADFILPTFAGKEVAVASTKAYVAQVFTLLIFAGKIAGIDMEDELRKFVLNCKITQFDRSLFKEIYKFKKIFFVGRGQDYVTSLEGALKLKEIAYINCIGIPAGELKHGTLALVDEETLVVVTSTRGDLKEKIENNIQEIRARGGKILLLSQLDHNIDVEYKIKLEENLEWLMPIESIFYLQQLALEFCLEKGLDPDKPRNLAKSVTVE